MKHVSARIGLRCAAIAVLFHSVFAPALAQVVATIPVPSNSNASVDVNSATGNVYTSGGASGGQQVTWISGATNAVVATLGAGSGAHINPVTNKLYAAGVYSGSILVYDGADGHLIKTIGAFGCPVGTAVDTSANRVWGVAQCGGGNDPVFRMDGAADTLTSGYIGSGGVLGSVVVNPNTHIAYLQASGVSKKVHPDTLAVSNSPFSGIVFAVNASTNRLYAWSSSGIQVVDGSSEAILAVLPAAGWVAVNPARQRVYVSDTSAAPYSVKVFDSASHALLGTMALPSGWSPGSLAVNSSTGRVYVLTYSGSSSQLVVLEDSTGAPPAPTLTSIVVTPADPSIEVGQVQPFTATGTYSDGSSRVLASSGAGLSLAGSVTFGGSGDQTGNGIAVAGGSVYWTGRDAAVGSTGDGRYGSYNTALTTSNFNQTLGGSYAELTGVAALAGSIYVGGSSRPPALTVDNVGGWENKPVAFRASASSGARDWLRQVSGPGYTDRVFGYSGTEWSSDIATGPGGIYLAGGGENWGGTSHYALWLTKFNELGSKQWSVTFGQPGAFTPANGLAVVGADIYVAAQAGDTALIRKYRDAGTSATLEFGNSYGSGAFNDLEPLDGHVYAVGHSGTDARVVKIDPAGAQVWSVSHDFGTGSDALTSVVGYNGRLFAIGRAGGNGILVEINPATGQRIGSPVNHSGVTFNRITSDGAGRLYAIGTAATATSGQDVVITAYATGGSEVAWSSSNTAVATIGSGGVAAGAQPGVTTITATSGGVSGNTSLTVVSPNQAPDANAGSDQVVEATGPGGAAVTLDGSGSSDPDGDALTYVWTGAFGAVSGVGPVVALPLGAHTLTLTADDGQATDSDTVQVTVRDSTAPLLQLPAALTVEAVSSAGTVLHYTASASDAVDPVPSLACTPASGSTFALGTTTVSCSAADDFGNASVGSFTVSVVDTTAPVLTVPEPITVFAGYPDEAVVSYSFSVADSVDPGPSAFCSPMSGASFALGTTTVFCTASDASGNGSTASFTVTVIDSGAPVLSVPADITASATGPDGAVVIYAVSAMDGFDADPAVSCEPGSGTTFALGTTPVSCTATDDSGNGASASFTVTVIDDGAPAVTVPSDITVNATSPAGAVVNFTATASDTVDPGTAIACTPPSGSTFAVGATVVTCTATDDAGNSASASFFVTVRGAEEQVDNAIAVIDSYGLPQGTEGSLTSKLMAAQDSLEAGNTTAACNQIKAFINEVKAQSGKALTKEQADALIAAARQIQAAIGC